MKFSEKYMVKAISLTIAEKMWIESEQRFNTEVLQFFHPGAAGISIILEAVKRYGMVPDSAYPSVIRAADKDIFNLNMEKYLEFALTSPQKLNELGKSLSDVRKMIEDIFGNPQNFSVTADYFSYVDYFKWLFCVS